MVVKVINQVYRPSKKLQLSKNMEYTLPKMSIKTITAHATNKVFLLTCFVSALLRITVSVLTTRYRMQVSKSSPADLKDNMHMGIPRRQAMMVIPLPTCVLGVIFPNP